MAKKFSTKIKSFTAKTRTRNNAVFKQSVQEVAAVANEPVSQGGRMRVDTGFLRNSQVVGLNSSPSGPSNKDRDSMGNLEDVLLTIAQATVYDVVYIGWSASYARFREYKDGFVEGAVKKWPSIVSKNTRRAKREIR